MACRLSNLFRHLYINSRSLSTSSYQIVNHERLLPNAVLNFQNLTNSNMSVTKEMDFTFSPRAIDLGFTIPPSQISKISIIDTPISINRHIKEPLGILYNKEDITPEKSIDLPTHGDVIEKLAVRMIVIRKHKMKIHKLKKFRRKRKVLLMKIQTRRHIRKEKHFKREIMYMLNKADQFDAKQYVQNKINILTQEILPTRWRGEVIPEDMIRQFMEEYRQKKLAKRNRKRLTLD